MWVLGGWRQEKDCCGAGREEGGEVRREGEVKKLSFRFLERGVKVEEIGLGLIADVRVGLGRGDEQVGLGALRGPILIILSGAWLIITNNL